MKEILVIMGVYGFLDSLMIKWGVWLYLEEKASRSDKKWMYQAVNCLFCRSFHLISLISIIYAMLTGFRIEVLLLAIVVSGLVQIIRR